MIRTRWQAPVYRMHHPKWSFAPSSGEGARRKGGRFNRPGVSALYTCVQIECAINEASQGFAFKVQPMTLVSYTVDHDNLLDLRTARVCRAAGIDANELSCAWERIASDGKQPPSWTMADTLIGSGVGGIIVPSFAPGRLADHANIVFWRWSDSPPERVEVHDPEARLPRDQSSWGT